jgi:hypothetical protein
MKYLRIKVNNAVKVLNLVKQFIIVPSSIDLEGKDKYNYEVTKRNLITISEPVSKNTYIEMLNGVKKRLGIDSSVTHGHCNYKIYAFGTDKDIIDKEFGSRVYFEDKHKKDKHKKEDKISSVLNIERPKVEIKTFAEIEEEDRQRAGNVKSKAFVKLIAPYKYALEDKKNEGSISSEVKTVDKAPEQTEVKTESKPKKKANKRTLAVLDDTDTDKKETNTAVKVKTPNNKTKAVKKRASTSKNTKKNDSVKNNFVTALNFLICKYSELGDEDAVRKQNVLNEIKKDIEDKHIEVE